MRSTSDLDACRAKPHAFVHTSSSTTTLLLQQEILVPVAAFGLVSNSLSSERRSSSDVVIRIPAGVERKSTPDKKAPRPEPVEKSRNAAAGTHKNPAVHGHRSSFTQSGRGDSQMHQKFPVSQQNEATHSHSIWPRPSAGGEGGQRRLPASGSRPLCSGPGLGCRGDPLPMGQFA